MKIEIEHAAPVLEEGKSKFEYSIKNWFIVGKYLPLGETCNCKMEKFDILVYIPGLKATKKELTQLAKDNLYGKTV